MNAAKIYAGVLHALAEEDGNAASLATEIKIIASCLAEIPEYMRLMDSPNITREEKTEMIDTAFADAHPYIKNLLKILAGKRHLHLFPECASEFLRLYEAAQGIEKARITLALPADAGLLEKIRGRLCAATGKNIVLQTEIDPELIGGMVLEMEGRRFDNSIRTKLRNISACMAGKSAEE